MTENTWLSMALGGVGGGSREGERGGAQEGTFGWTCSWKSVLFKDNFAQQFIVIQIDSHISDSNLNLSSKSNFFIDASY